MFSKAGVLAQGCSWEEASKLNSYLHELDELKNLSCFADRYYAGHVLAENISVVGKAHLWRLSELAHSVCQLFNEGHIVSSLILCRSIMETVLFLEDFQNHVVDLTKAQDVESLKVFVIRKMFSIRRLDFLNEMPEMQATNIISVLGKIC